MQTNRDISGVLPKHQYSIPIEGMTCASCVSRIEEAVGRVEGLESVEVNLASERALVQIQAPEVLGKVLAAIRKAGYDVSAEETQILDGDKGSKFDDAKELELSKNRRTLIFSGLLTFPLVLPMLFEPFGFHWMLPLWLQLILATPVQFIFGARFYKAAYRALLAKAGNMDLLVALGTSAAYGLSIFQIYEHWGALEHLTNMGGHIYFESSAVIITLILLGKYLEARAKQQTSAAIKALQNLTPDVALILRNGSQIEVSLDEVEIGDTVVVKPGKRVPVDGVVRLGTTQVDESMMTGESLPVLKSMGDMVTGGTINTDGMIQVETQAIGSETRLAKIIRLVESAQAAKAPIQRLVDRVSAVFVPVVILIAAITILSWGMMSGDWNQAIINGVAVLIIACPCALGLATPTSIMVGTGLAAKNGILIKDAEALEVAHTITTVAFDKTGTLTEGKPVVSYFQSFGMAEVDVLKIAAAIQSASEHPLAKAMVERAKDEALQIQPVTEMKSIPGLGVEAQYMGKKYVIGHARLMKERKLATEALANSIRVLQTQGMSVSLIGDLESLRIIGLIGFEDRIKTGAKQTIQALGALGIKTIMITGDNKGSADSVARSLGITEVRAEVLPDGKGREIEILKARNEVVAMVGDGINDAPALALSDVGIAMSTGTDVAMHSAAITLLRGNPLLIPDAIEISKRTYRKIQQNLFWAFIYNIIGIPLAALGMLNPMLAGGAMALSSVSVITNALLLKRWKPNNQKQT